jgi:hypothetical protein
MDIRNVLLDALPPAAGALHNNFNSARDTVLVLRGQVEQYALSHPQPTYRVSRHVYDGVPVNVQGPFLAQ